MAQASYLIVGIPTNPGEALPLRQEITAWANDEKNEHQVSLFLRALTNLQARLVERKLGYFQVAGALTLDRYQSQRELTYQGFTHIL